MPTTGWNPRVLQIHPSRWCNLRCLHCYSSSGPAEKGGLPVSLLQRAIADAAAEGYTVASISGGEPLMYDGLVPLLESAQAAGMRTSLVTNGILLDEARLAELRPCLEFVAISLDGRPAVHDQIRGSRGAFERMAGRLPMLRASGVPFGFVYTLSSASIDDLIWALDFAIASGAVLFQIHPLDEVGRALVKLRGKAPGADDTLATWLAVKYLAAGYADQIAVVIDLVEHRRIDELTPELLRDGDVPAGPLADAVSPLVIEADGTVVPLSFGIDRRCALGSLHDAGLSALARRWLAAPAGYRRFRGICRDAHRRVDAGDVKLLTWHQEIVSAARITR